MITKLLKEVGVFLYGLVVISLSLSLAILFIPIYIYRWVLSKVAKYFYKGRIGEPLTAFGNVFGVEFLPSGSLHPPRCNAVATMVFDGKVSAKELQELVSSRLLSYQELRYSELTQYVESWMGFMFWKQDREFSLKNHIFSHPLNCKTDEEMEESVCHAVEDLLNKPFHSKRSPWECYVVENYQNEQLAKKCINPEMTLLIYRIHHCLADGYSVLYMLIEGVLGTPLSTISLPTPEQLQLSSWGEKLSFFLTLPIRLVQDLARYCLLHFSPRTPFHIPDNEKAWHQLFARSAPVSIELIKNIKEKQGVSFTGVLLAAVSGGLAKSLPSIRKPGQYIKSIPFFTMLPLPGHPNKLRNHATLAYFHLPTCETLSSAERLESVEEMLKKAKRTIFPIFFLVAVNLLGSLFAGMTKLLVRNRYLPAGLTNFPGPGIQMNLNGKRCMTADFVAGALTGDSGIGFMMLSFQDHVRITLSVEEAVMSRNKANELVEHIWAEFQVLYKLEEKPKICSGPDVRIPLTEKKFHAF